MKKLEFALILSAGILAGIVAAAPAEHAPAPPRHPGPGTQERRLRFRNGPGMWMVFSQLSEEERREMEKLQRENPEEFRKIMSEKADKLYREREKRRAELRELAGKCRNAATPEEKANLKKQLAEEVSKDFRRHLEANRKQIGEMKRRTAQLEERLQRREKNMDKAVEDFVNALIEGKAPPRRRNSR